MAHPPLLRYLTGSEKISVKNSDIQYKTDPLERLSKIFRGAKCLQCPQFLSDFFTAAPIEFKKPIESIEKIFVSMNFAYKRKGGGQVYLAFPRPWG